MTNTKGYHKPVWYQVQADAEDLLLMLAAGDTTYHKLEKKYACRAETIRLAVIDKIGKERYRQYITPGRGKGKGRMAEDVQIAHQLHVMRQIKFWECAACGWDTRGPEWKFPSDQVPDQCPKCYSYGFEERRTPGGGAIHHEP